MVVFGPDNDKGGSCVIDNDCIKSRNWPSEYSSHEACEITFTVTHYFACRKTLTFEQKQSKVLHKKLYFLLQNLGRQKLLLGICQNLRKSCLVQMKVC